MKYRSRFEIVAAMLQSAVGGATKTKLMYEAFLSHNQMEEYRKFLLEKNLISLTQDNKHYVPTRRGLQLLKKYEEIKDTVAVRNAEGVSLEEVPIPTEVEGSTGLPQHPDQRRS